MHHTVPKQSLSASPALLSIMPRLTLSSLSLTSNPTCGPFAPSSRKYSNPWCPPAMAICRRDISRICTSDARHVQRLCLSPGRLIGRRYISSAYCLPTVALVALDPSTSRRLMIPTCCSYGTILTNLCSHDVYSLARWRSRTASANQVVLCLKKTGDV
jgi:hypothetical protein